MFAEKTHKTNRDRNVEHKENSYHRTKQTG